MFDYYKVLGPLIRSLDPEQAHRLGILALRSGLLPCEQAAEGEALAVDLWGLHFPNPIGLAAGFDKNAEVPDAMLGLGFGFVEIGTVTPQPQAGNSRPRLFRLPEERAVINRMGFNNHGAIAVLSRLARRPPVPAGGRRPGVIGGNVGPNRTASDPASDCAQALTMLAPLVDYVVVNVSSPNTPGLRALQRREALEGLLLRCRAARDRMRPGLPLLVKVSPDLTQDERADVAEVVLEAAIDGLVATNTTTERPAGLRGRWRSEEGGLSGAPLFDRSTEVLAEFRRLTRGQLPLIGVGGVASGADAYAKIRAGASLVQLYTALVYQGPALVGRIVRELAVLLQRDGFASVTEAVGADVPVGAPRAAAIAGIAP